ncbi:hypothetical protein QTL95_21480 [Rhizobium sp. S152]|uniref:hypothetical protein n=1 Tax=Rhizobium sp. S152 TaxID=3055038 RepID=UPI0025A9F307|nr:hypothetical protein [Rhizobium sp. S152]MDM9628472.1 hypothetical protein [Rhizobium sp. S152]
MTKTPIGQPWANEETGTYWASPNEVTLAEVHPLLMAVLLMRLDYADWSLCSVDVYDMGSGAPLGSFDIGFNPRSGGACGYFNAVGFEQIMSKPLWFNCSGDESDVIEAFYLLMRNAGHVQ